MHLCANRAHVLKYKKTLQLHSVEASTVCQMEKHLEVWKNLAHKLLKARSAWKMDEIRSQGKAACVPRNKKKHVMISFNDSPAKWRASFQGMSYSHKSSLPGWWEIPCKWSDWDQIFHPFCTWLSIDYVKCYPLVKNTASSLSLPVAKGSYTLANFLIYDTL